jgi:imidazolonepropionase-like amidohydrolase/ABC-type multidrug transport system permease subunit
MRAYFSLITIYLRLAMREKSVLFFNYVFPLIFFFAFGQVLGGASSGAMPRIVAMVIVIGILGSGLFGAGIRSVAEREAGILRRYKVAPISPAPILVASMVTGWLLYLPSVALVLLLSRFVYKMPLPDQFLSLLFLITLGCFAFRAMGLIIASVANSVAESNVLVQILYMPMLFLSGATFPFSSMPDWAQVASQFLPATYLNTGLQHVLIHNQGLGAGLWPLAALLFASALGLLISVKLFRWEKEERISTASKAWVAGVILPFLVLGGWEAYSRDHIRQSKVLDRELRRNQSRMIRGARLFLGDGKVIDNGAILMRNGRIERIWEGQYPEAESLRAIAVEAAGKTVLPGLIDVHIHLGAPGGLLAQRKQFDPEEALARPLRAYLYSGVTAVRSVGDFTTQALAQRNKIRSGETLASELLVAGPLFTAAGGHGTEYFKNAPESVRAMAVQEFVRTPETAQQASAMVAELDAQGVDAIKAVLDAGIPGMLFQRMDVAVLDAIARRAKKEGLPLSIHTGSSVDVRDAIAAGAVSIEHGSDRDAIPEELLKQMAARGIFYDPTLSVQEAIEQLQSGKPDLLERSLVQQVAPKGLIAATRASLAARKGKAAGASRGSHATANLVRAWKAGVPLAAGSDSGNMLLVHGPAIHRELQLWVAAGIRPAAALQAATANAARLLGIDNRTGILRPGYEATMLIVDGNPLADITATERISMVFFRGERVDRPGLFEDE